MIRLSLIVGLLFFLTPPSALSQSNWNSAFVRDVRAQGSNDSDYRIVFQAWRSLQRQNSRGVRQINVNEYFESRFDGPAGSWNAALSQNASGSMSGRFSFDLKNFSSDGQRVPANEWSELKAQWNSLLGSEFASLIQTPLLPIQLFEGMEPTGQARLERINGANHWRIEMRGSGRSFYQRVTLWVHEELGYLSRSRAVMDSRSASITAVTDYQRVRGLDIPVNRQFEGKVQTRRRSRVSTLYFRVNGNYSNFSLR